MDNQTAQSESGKAFFHLLAQPVISYWNAVRRKEKSVLIAWSLGALAATFGVFGHHDAYLYLGLVLLAGLSIWIGHQHIQKLALEGYSRRDQKIMYASAVLIAGPLAYALLMLLTLAITLAFIAIMLLVAGFIIRAFLNNSERQTIKRGANSHLTSEGNAKVAFATERDAQVAAGEMAAKGEGLMKPYQCEEGDHFHIGH